MPLFRNFLLVGLIIAFLFSCVNQKVLYPSPKIGFDINALDKEGLIGEANAKVALDYEFCIPAHNSYINQVRQIDPSLKFHKKSRGRVGCGKDKWLCIGNTHQEYARLKLQRLAELTYVERIERTYFE